MSIALPCARASRRSTGIAGKPQSGTARCESRKFGRTGRSVSEIGFGAWAIGGAWGEVNDDDALAALHAALDAGVTFIDTADVYGDGRSEQLIAEVHEGARRRAARSSPPRPAAGCRSRSRRGLQRREPDRLGSTAASRTSRSIRSTSCSCIARRRTSTTTRRCSSALDRLVEQGKIRNYGVSVERVEEALKAIEYPGVVSVQIIFNAFRQRPAELFFDAGEGERMSPSSPACRWPAACCPASSSADTKFEATDHRQFNRNGEAFDVGETFSGVPYEVGLEAVEKIRPLVSGDTTMAKFALRWILMFDAVTRGHSRRPQSGAGGFQCRGRSTCAAVGRA